MAYIANVQLGDARFTPLSPGDQLGIPYELFTEFDGNFYQLWAVKPDKEGLYRPGPTTIRVGHPDVRIGTDIGVGSWGRSVTFSESIGPGDLIFFAQYRREMNGKLISLPSLFTLPTDGYTAIPEPDVPGWYLTGHQQASDSGLVIVMLPHDMSGSWMNEYSYSRSRNAPRLSVGIRDYGPGSGLAQVMGDLVEITLGTGEHGPEYDGPIELPITIENDYIVPEGCRILATVKCYNDDGDPMELQTWWGPVSAGAQRLNAGVHTLSIDRVHVVRESISRLNYMVYSGNASARFPVALITTDGD